MVTAIHQGPGPLRPLATSRVASPGPRLIWAALTTDKYLMAQSSREAIPRCPRCKKNLPSDIDGEALAWTYRRDVLGVDWSCSPDSSSVICYLCYVREVLQWA